jgi:hypothetical protein
METHQEHVREKLLHSKTSALPLNWSVTKGDGIQLSTSLDSLRLKDIESEH